MQRLLITAIALSMVSRARAEALKTFLAPDLGQEGDLAKLKAQVYGMQTDPVTPPPSQPEPSEPHERASLDQEASAGAMSPDSAIQLSPALSLIHI